MEGLVQRDRNSRTAGSAVCGGHLPAFRECPMKSHRSSVLLTAVLLLLSMALLRPIRAGAQETSEGVKSGNYNLKQSIEMG